MTAGNEWSAHFIPVADEDSGSILDVSDNISFKIWKDPRIYCLKTWVKKENAVKKVKIK
jgi:hypothetical protein